MARKGFLIKFKKRKPDTHKGSYGRILIVAGSWGMAGAAYLCCEGAYRSGAGLVYLCLPKSIYPILASRTICTVMFPQKETPSGTFSPEAVDDVLSIAQKCDAMAIGPGLSQNPQTGEFVKKLLPALAIPAVIDADALNLISDKPEILNQMKITPVITPHPGELSRLIKISVEEIQKDRQSVTMDVARKFNVVAVLKGHRTVVSDGKRIYVNKTGNPGMATGGSGDVLTGMIPTFIGQGFGAFESACTAVYLHGLAGDIAAKKYGEISMIATDILESLPQAFKLFVTY